MPYASSSNAIARRLIPLLAPAVLLLSAGAAGSAPPKTLDGLTLGSTGGQYSMKVQPLLQLQHQARLVPEGEDQNSFAVKRAQLRFSGHAFLPEVRYKIMLSLAGTNGGPTVDLRDAWIDLRFSDYAQVKIGQFLLYDVENLVPTWALQMVDRSSVYYEFGMERELGIDIHGRALSNHLEYNLFMVNGYGRNRLSKNSSLRFGARLVVNVLGHHGYMVSDIGHSAEPHLAIGLAAIWDPKYADTQDQTLWRPTADIAFRWQGFSALAAGYFVINTDRDAYDAGVVGQLGYFVWPSRLELALRYARIMNHGARGAAGNSGGQVGAVGLTWFVFGHSLAAQLEYAAATPGHTFERLEHRITTQLQLFLK